MKYERLTKRAGFYKDIDLKDEWGYSHIYQRLSELENKIEDGQLKELRICKNETKSNPVDEFICSECGLIMQDYCKKRLDEDGDEYFFEFEIKYCPCCGAKVVEE